MTRRTRTRLFFALCPLLFGGMGQVPFCQQNQNDSFRGDIDRVGDVVVVRPVDIGVPPPVYVVTANPEIRQLRIYDAYNRTFVKSPNGFFPLAVQTGPMTTQLAVAPGDQTRVVTLDSHDDTVHLLRTTGDSRGDAFTYVGAGVRTGRAPSDVTAVLVDETLRVFVAVPDPGHVEVFDLDPRDGALLADAVVELPTGAHPARLAVDPTGDAVVVTDALLDTVHVIRAQDSTYDRSLDVGGPTVEVATGLVDPGDGLGPVAIVLRRDEPRAVALRLLRPTYREDAYAVLGSAQLFEYGAAVYIPDAADTAETDPTVCCPPSVGFPDEEATKAWALVLSENGHGQYLRFDGERPDGRRGVFRLIDTFPPGPGYAQRDGGANPAFLTSSDDTARAPTLIQRERDTLGEPPRFDFVEPGLTLTFTYGGSPPRTRGRTASYSMGAIVIDNDGRPFEQRDVLPGDLLFIPVASDDDRCPADGFLQKPIADVVGDDVTLVGLTPDEQACLQLYGPFTASVFVDDAFTVTSSEAGYLGRLHFDDDDREPRVLVQPHMDFSLQRAAGGPPDLGSQVVAELASNVQPIDVFFAQEQTLTNLDGFDREGLVLTAAAGAEVFLPGVNDNDPPRPVRRVFIGVSGATGRLIELNETETVLEFVNADDR